MADKRNGYLEPRNRLRIVLQHVDVACGQQHIPGLAQHCQYLAAGLRRRWSC
jgi:hypothetical protein